jgi:hypothetical protein|tara:strand:- start:778 stop:1278 length:501 start_codon:yes stop_codon:yes gene_type:complete
MLKKLAVICFLILSTPAFAANSPISGNVQAKCSIWTETQGVYGNPLPNKLDTLPASGGTKASIRVDIAQANFYKTRFTHPISFSSSPTLSDTITWTGSTVVGQVSVSGMSAYEAAKVVSPSNVTTFDMTLAGSTWFTVSSTALYGYNKSFPAGSYVAQIVAECIAK